jgi:phosphoglycolate phosphatase-like HAD superfamily hydrolase
VDINEGINAGCKYVIGITTGAFTRDELLPYKPTHIIDDIAEVIGIIAPSHAMAVKG